MARSGSKRNLRLLRQGTGVGDPVPNLVGDDLDDRHARIVLVAFVHAVFQVAEPCRCPRPMNIASVPVPPRKANRAGILTSWTNVS